ncbi:TonB-dependent receptor plug domain-containing protein [Lacinutrix sp. Hel_I_90]|uniref:TonB-dependent receptor plug domain-containing protein n=1 Tax=Lacinutrix sp. Hel_I_90 TaxID=1249999 RepID=UPI0005C8F89E|nr:TonB-dependent receptor plug domain-containing protein [Lacinutrix sp. Hel_I_90]
MKTILQLLLISSFTLSGLAQNHVSQEKESISGIVVDEDGNPFPNVSVVVNGEENGTETGPFGNYSISASVGETLVFSFNGYQSSTAKILSVEPININMQRAAPKEGEVVSLAMGLNKKKDRIGYGYKEVNSELITQANNPSALQSLDGKVSGVDVISSNNGGASSIRFRGSRSLKGNSDALIVIDGTISSYSFLESLDPNLIESMTVLKGASGAALYGSQGSNGVVVVKTKKGTTSVKQTKAISKPKPLYYKEKLKVDIKTVKPDYIEALSNSNSNDAAFTIYAKQRENYKNNASYYIDVYNYFKARKGEEYTRKILDDVIKFEMNNFEMLKGLAFQLEANKEYNLASSLYKRLVLLEPEVAQSYLDLASIYEKVDKPQKAFDILNSLLILTKNADDLNAIVKHNINGLTQAQPTVNTEEMESFNSINTTYDLRVVASWNRENTNVNLQVVEPSREFASNENRQTQTGGELKASFNSYGPEEYTIRNAKPGDYFVRLIYNGDHHTEDVDTYVKLNIYKNYGKKNQKEEIKIIKLETSNGEETVANIKI